MIKKHAESTLRNWSKEELIKEVMCLEHNLKVEESRSEHIYTCVLQCEKNNKIFANELGKVLEIWNRSGKYE